MTDNEFRQRIIPRYKTMYAVAFGIFRNSDDAQDAVQETVARLWADRHSLADIDNPSAFCCRAVRNRCIDMLRTRQLDPLGEISIADTVSADNQARFNSTLGYVSRVLESFPEKQRRVLSLSLISQLSNDEIVAATGLTDANVRQILSRGRLKLKAIISNEINH